GKGEPDPSIAARRLDDHATRPEPTLPLRRLDDRRTDPVFHRAARVVELRLRVDWGPHPLRDPTQPDQRRPAYRLQHLVVWGDVAWRGHPRLAPTEIAPSGHRPLCLDFHVPCSGVPSADALSLMNRTGSTTQWSTRLSPLRAGTNFRLPTPAIAAESNSA